MASLARAERGRLSKVLMIDYKKEASAQRISRLAENATATDLEARGRPIQIQRHVSTAIGVITAMPIRVSEARTKGMKNYRTHRSQLFSFWKWLFYGFALALK